jgi:hypothetical protein
LSNTGEIIPSSVSGRLSRQVGMFGSLGCIGRMAISGPGADKFFVVVYDPTLSPPSPTREVRAVAFGYKR